MSRGRARLQPPPPGTRTTTLAAVLVLVLLAVVALPLRCDAASAGGEEEEEQQPLDYREALEKSLLYFEAQRSGRLPYSQRVTWRGHSGLTDGLQQGVDLVGGYYDAGDHVKFGLPMAFTVTMLSWGAIDFAADIAAAGEWRHALEAIKWGTDYFVKAHTHPFVYWPRFVSLRRGGQKLYQKNLDIEVCREALLYSLEHRVALVAFSQDDCYTTFDDNPLVDFFLVYHEPK
ncbi:hypothetical protein OsI_31260 [Oryza sativa Indica Group]|uniref:cellulase n=1 Tax=Oryza sativa subsp. indica TaxID=39946 RepID=B8BF38_ORYSI|nr:hypothetical protein OsI_31260 [Oryza sativa Indica Group]